MRYNHIQQKAWSLFEIGPTNIPVIRKDRFKDVANGMGMISRLRWLNDTARHEMQGGGYGISRVANCTYI